MSNALKKFNKCHGRAVGMIKRHWEIWREADDNDEWDESDDDLFRAGIVLAVAAMDSYFTDRFCEALTPYIKRNGTNSGLENLLRKAGLDTGTAVSMFDNKRPKRVLSNMVKRHLSTFVTQNFKSVNNLYKCIGFEKPITIIAQEKAKRKHLLKSIEKLVERRHKIVHAGDYNSHGNLNAIEYQRLFKKILELKLLVTNVDKALRDEKI